MENKGNFKLSKYVGMMAELRHTTGCTSQEARRALEAIDGTEFQGDYFMLCKLCEFLCVDKYNTFEEAFIASQSHRKRSPKPQPYTKKKIIMVDIVNKDNLEYMKEIPTNRVNLTYCDILYGTGKKFKDYQDLKPTKEIIYEHYVPRLKEMYRILTNTGSIYLQMDIRINHWIRCIMDDIFGYENFRNQITVKYNLGGRGKREFAKKHDIIVVYSKSGDFIFNDEDIRIPYKSVISKKQDRPNITAEKLAKGTIPTNVWEDIPNGLRVKKHTDYFSEKHEKILERIILASSNEGDLVGDLVGDFYLGSGTTAVVADRLGRNFIGCDITPRAIEVTKERLIGHK